MSVTYSILGLSKCHCSVRTLLSPAAVFGELLAPLLLLLLFLLGAAVPGGFARPDPHCSRAAQGGMANADWSKGLKQRQLSSKASF